MDSSMSDTTLSQISDPLADAAFTEAVSKDDKGVYIMGADGSKRRITQLEVEDD